MSVPILPVSNRPQPPRKRGIPKVVEVALAVIVAVSLVASGYWLAAQSIAMCAA